MSDMRPTDEQLAAWLYAAEYDWNTPGSDTPARDMKFPEDYDREYQPTLAAIFQELIDSRAELVRLRAQVASIGRVHPGTCSPVETHPDDREINEYIDKAESFSEAMFEISEKYEVPVTNNMDRWQDGQFVRHVGEFIGDVKAAAVKHLT